MWVQTRQGEQAVAQVAHPHSCLEKGTLVTVFMPDYRICSRDAKEDPEILSRTAPGRWVAVLRTGNLSLLGRSRFGDTLVRVPIASSGERKAWIFLVCASGLLPERAMRVGMK
jgi:hypothetical protein